MRTYLLICSLAWLNACAPIEAPAPKTSLEIQATQSQIFTGCKKDTFNSIMSVLQDSGYIIKSANLETGFISAESPVENSSNNNLHNALAAASIFYSVLNASQLQNPSMNTFKMGKKPHSEQKTAVSATVEELKASRTRVRLNFVDRHKVFASDGSRNTQDKQIHDANIYQNVFNKIDQELFIRNG